MSNDLEIKKKNRSAIRGAVTRAVNEFCASINVEKPDEDTVRTNYEVLLSRYEELSSLDSQINTLLCDATEKELEEEMVACDGYLRKFTSCKVKYNRIFGDALTGTISTSDTGRRKFKLPQIQFKHYDGSIKGWLSFWVQFKKIHEDNSIDKNDKIEYLIQATLPGSRARQLVESYPAMDDNYEKIIDSMRSRFGREDLQIEVYVRELLKIILTNTECKQIVDIATLYDKIETQLRALETLGITSDKCAAMLFPLIESCLPHDLLRVWQRSGQFHAVPEITESEEDADPPQISLSPLEIRLKNLMLFLKNEVENEQRISLAVEGFGLSENRSSAKTGSSEGSNKPRHPHRKSFEGSTAMGLVNSAASGSTTCCLFCGGSHGSESCFKAQRMSLLQKRGVLPGKGACYRCLKIGHNAKKCRGRLRCVACSRSHVVLMCPELPTNQDTVRPTEDQGQLDRSKPDVSTDQTQTLANQSSNTHVFLQTLKVTLVGTKGSKIVRALIDTGSQRSYILKETAARLGFPAQGHEKLIHCLFGGAQQQSTHICYKVTISKGTYTYTFNALGQTKICGDVAPVFSGPWIEEMKILGIQTSDSGDTGPIELLIGADIVGSLYTGARHELPCGLVAMETLVGWTLMGKMPGNVERSDVVATTLNLFVNSASISDLWDLEAIGIKAPLDKHTKEEMAAAAKELFLKTVRVDEEGRYEVRLPWVEGHPPLSTNFRVAKKRLDSTIRKLKTENLFEKYGQIFSEWKDENIIEEINPPVCDEEGSHHYLPHRPLLKEISTTTKIRPVFDASAHESGKPSINNCLEKGPNLIELIPSILLKFRQNKIGVVSDIKKAFLQISINEQDRDFLRFLWTDSQGQQVVFRHRRVVFGLNSSPFLLGATLEYHLNQAIARGKLITSGDAVYSQETLERLKKSFYVDNCVTSLPDEESVSKFIREATAVMAEGKFDLRGWERTQRTDFILTATKDENPCLVLGLNWCPKKDVLSINAKFLDCDLDVEDMPVTKRRILSLTQKVFDPIGYTCPAVLAPKLMLQNLWKDQLTWDQPVDDATAEFFKVWVKDLFNLSSIEIPRWIWTGSADTRDLSLHTFCDASKDAYACAVFLRVTQREKVSVFLLAAKTRVAPLKRSNSKMTIPRLELLAATIGARLYAHVRENLDEVMECYFWSDSSTVISWIQREEEWGVFVWNRIAEIRKLTPADRWNHLPGVLNPADLPSRGCSPKQLAESKWWEGPRWLYDPIDSWPATTAITCNEDEINAERRKKLVTTLSVSENFNWHLDHFSKYDKTVRMIAWVFRFIYNCRNPSNKQKSELTAEEHNKAETFIFKEIQKTSFSMENSRIRSLNPFLDEKGIIRLKSRVSNREDTDNYRFPVLLPPEHPTVKILIMDTHIKSCHVGTQGLLSLLREKFWVLGGRRTVRSVLFKCIACKRHTAKPLAVDPPPLPLDRVRDAVAFEVTGVDLAGPLYLKDGTKAWICLFTCAIFRAVHLELTTSLSTVSFMQALRRFVSRRGRPVTIYSDNGTNFVGAENALSDLDWDSITRETAIQRISWKFNPPTAAWWGGFWERLIGVLKRLLRRVLVRASLDYESLLTLLCDCEAIVNARPLTYLSEDPNELIALTPSMFLRDRAESGLPDCDAVDSASLNRKVRKIQTLRENLRVRFRAEYLGQLKLVSDKKTNHRVSVGDLVLVGSDNTKRLEWPIGRIVEVLPGKDGHIRLVQVQTSKGLMLRPVQRLYHLKYCSVPEFGEKYPQSSSQLEETCFSEDYPGDFDFNAAKETVESTSSDSAVVPKKNETQLSRVSKSVKCVSAGVKVPVVKTTRSGRVLKTPQRFVMTSL